MHATIRNCTLIPLFAAFFWGCAQDQATDSCQAASDHVFACTGERLTTSSCSDTSASELLGLSCEQLAAASSDNGSADSFGRQAWCAVFGCEPEGPQHLLVDVTLSGIWTLAESCTEMQDVHTGSLCGLAYQLTINENIVSQHFTVNNREQMLDECGESWYEGAAGGTQFLVPIAELAEAPTIIEFLHTKEAVEPEGFVPSDTSYFEMNDNECRRNSADYYWSITPFALGDIQAFFRATIEVDAQDLPELTLVQPTASTTLPETTVQTEQGAVQAYELGITCQFFSCEGSRCEYECALN